MFFKRRDSLESELCQSIIRSEIERRKTDVEVERLKSDVEKRRLELEMEHIEARGREDRENLKLRAVLREQQRERAALARDAKARKHAAGGSAPPAGARNPNCPVCAQNPSRTVQDTLNHYAYCLGSPISTEEAQQVM